MQTIRTSERTSKQNPWLVLEALGQSLWMDFISRGAITSGQLQALIKADGVSGVTSNPSIFEKAIAKSRDYDAAIRTLSLKGRSSDQIYEELTVGDIQRVADLLRPTYDRDRRDGFVSLEVSPALAHDTHGTILEARRLWALVDRPNAMIKVPATRAGLPAIRQLTSDGLNVNITLLFGLPRYQEVVEAYIAGLEDRAAKGQPLEHVASVASFFLSRIDVLIDPRLETIAAAGQPEAATAARLQGQIAIASAQVAYQIYRQVFPGGRFKRLASQGARPQRLLWASTSTKNPAYSDVKYVEALIGADTINTVPLETLDAYRDHGHPELTLERGVAAAQQALHDLAALGIDLDRATQQLEDEGVVAFIAAFDRLMAALKAKQAAEPLPYSQAAGD